MGIENSYRTSKNKQEILGALMDIYSEGTPINIWQTLGQRRLIVNVKIQQIDLKTSSIVVTPYSSVDSESLIKLQTDSTVYIKDEARSIVFKQERPANKNKSGLVQLFIPDEVKMFEKRAEVRTVFSGFEKNLGTELYIGNRIDISSKSLRGELHNISLSGIGFFLESRYARLFFEKDKIKIKSIAHYVFPRPIFGAVVYIKADSNSKRVLIGVRFDHQIDAEVLERILESISL